MIDVSRLLVLREVAAGGSLSAAARALRVTPSAVSQQVAALERSVGVPLVERSTRGVRLTEPGRRLVESADTIAAELASAQRHLAQLAAGHRGSLYVATFPSAGQRLLPRTVSGLAADNPDAEIMVVEHEPFDAVPMVRRGEADLGLVYHFFTARPPADWGIGDGLRYVPLRRDPIRLVLPAGHRLADADRLTLADLADEPWVQGRASVAEMLEHHASAAGFTPRVACVASDYLFMQSVVAAGMGVALVPTVALAADRTGLVVRTIDPTPDRYVGAVHPADRWHTPLARELIARLRSSATD